MKYNLEVEHLSVHNYKDILKKRNLLPGRRILLENIDENFALFEHRGIKNVSQLRKSVSTPRKISSIAAESGISEDYLIILKREMSSLEQKPVSLASFPGIDTLLIAKLNDAGIKTSKDYFESRLSETDELFCLCDLVRINGVGPVAAKAFYDAGYMSVSDVADADAAAILEKVSSINKIKQYYKANLGLKDMQFCIDFARLLINTCT